MVHSHVIAGAKGHEASFMLAASLVGVLMIGRGGPRSVRISLAAAVLGVSCVGAMLLHPLESGAGKAPRCAGKEATISRGGGDNRIIGTNRSDVIVAGGGQDTIRGGNGNDVICGEAGEDRLLGGRGGDAIYGGADSDFVDGGNGTDSLDGEDGTDRLLGERGNDRMLGGEGADRLEGDLGDDTLDGQAGDFDYLLGGLGNDRVNGGEGDGDVLLSDGGSDLLDGGPGEHDLASFALGGLGRLEGRGAPTVDLQQGIADVDGPDRLQNLEDVIAAEIGGRIIGNEAPNIIYGSSRFDWLYGGEPSTGPGDVALGGAGGEYCEGFEYDDCDQAQGGRGPVELTQRRDGALLIAGLGYNFGGPTRVYRENGAYWISDPFMHVFAENSGTCQLVSSSLARCPGPAELDGVLISGAGRIRIDPSVPVSVPVTLRGTPYGNVLIGGRGDDIIEGGQYALRGEFDVLRGGPGGDAISGTGDAQDELLGEAGSDLLIASEVCRGQLFHGGVGVDSVSFARLDSGANARIGGKVRAIAGDCQARDVISGSVENAEGSPAGDVLIGDEGRNRLLGRGGNDRLLGLSGPDRLVGGTGADAFLGGAGIDWLFAIDNRRDRMLDCGAPRGAQERVARDRIDPRGDSC